MLHTTSKHEFNISASYEVENSSLTIRLRNGENLGNVKIKTIEQISKNNIKINDDEGIKLAFIKAEEKNE